MKNITRIIMVLAVAFASCTSEVDENRPEWLDEKVDEIIVDKDLCDITSVTVYEFNDALYYHIYCGIWSCSYCHLYDANGNVVNGETENMEDFLKDKKLIEEFPACN